jgi:integrase
MAIDFALGLTAARKEAKKRMGEVATGRDPLSERRAQIAKAKAAATGTLEAIAKEYFKREARSVRSIGEIEAIFERTILPVLGKMQVGEIRRQDIIRLLDRIEDKRGPMAANRALQVLGRVFNWHAARSDDFKTPVVRGMRRASQTARERILSPDEIRSIWIAAEKRGGAFGALVKFWLLTAARRNEAARMTRAEVDASGVWTLPASRSKTKVDVVRPLSKAARDILASLPRIKGCEYYFTVTGTGPINGFSRAKCTFDKACGAKDWKLHDLRRTSRTLMSRIVSPDIAERCLGHVIPGMRKIYDQYQYVPEMLDAFEKLAAELQAIVSG